MIDALNWYGQPVRENRYVLLQIVRHTLRVVGRVWTTVKSRSRSWSKAQNRFAWLVALGALRWLGYVLLTSHPYG